MKTTVKLKWLVLLICGVLCASFFASCGDDDEDIGGNSPIVGTWKGTNGTWHFSYTFNSNGTGSGSGYTNRGSQYRCEFTWSGKNTVKCKGAAAEVSFDGETTTYDNWTTTFYVKGTTMTGGQWAGITFTKQ